MYNLKHLLSISDLDQHVESTGILNACVYRIPVGVYFLVTVHVNIPCKAMVKCHLRWEGKTDKASKVVVLMALSILSH